MYPFSHMSHGDKKYEIHSCGEQPETGLDSGHDSQLRRLAISSSYVSKAHRMYACPQRLLLSGEVTEWILNFYETKRQYVAPY